MEGSVAHVLRFLELGDLAHLASISRAFAACARPLDVSITHADLLRLGRLPPAAVAGFFRRVINSSAVRSLTVELDPCYARRALLLTILRAFTRCVLHESPGGAPLNPPAFGYASSLQSLRFRVASTTAIPPGFVGRSHQRFQSQCEDDQGDEKRRYCVCVDWSQVCIHHNTLVRRRVFKPEPHRNWMCWLLKDDWYNIFRWFPNLERLELPLAHNYALTPRLYQPHDLGLRPPPPASGSAEKELEEEYLPLMEFMFPMLAIKHGENRGACHHPALRELSLLCASDHTLLIDEKLECQHSATQLEKLNISCLSLNRKSLGSFIRNILAARVVSEALVVPDLRAFSIYTAPSACLATQRSADGAFTSHMVCDGFRRTRERYCRLALAFSTLVATKADSMRPCDCCGATSCRGARIRSYAPLVFPSCTSLTIDVCSLLAQEDLPLAFPRLERLACTLWIYEEHWAGVEGHRSHFECRLINLLSRLRSIALIEIEQAFDMPEEGREMPQLSLAPGAGSLVARSSTISRSRENLIKLVFPDLLKKYRAVWLVVPIILATEDASEQLVMVPLQGYEEHVQDNVCFTLVATGAEHWPTTPP